MRSPSRPRAVPLATQKEIQEVGNAFVKAEKMVDNAVKQHTNQALPRGRSSSKAMSESEDLETKVAEFREGLVSK